MNADVRADRADETRTISLGAGSDETVVVGLLNELIALRGRAPPRGGAVGPRREGGDLPRALGDRGCRRSDGSRRLPRCVRNVARPVDRSIAGRSSLLGRGPCGMLGLDLPRVRR